MAITDDQHLKEEGQLDLYKALADLVAAADNYFEEPSPENGVCFKVIIERARKVLQQ